MDTSAWAAGREESVHLALFPKTADVAALVDKPVLDVWERLLDIRGTVNASLEALRQSKQIGNSLQARVVISATGDDLALLQESASICRCCSSSPTSTSSGRRCPRFVSSARRE